MGKIYREPVVAMWTEARQNEWPVNLFLYLPLLDRSGATLAQLDLGAQMEKELFNEYSTILAGLLGKVLTVGVSSKGRSYLSHHTVTSGGGIKSRSSLSVNYRQLTNEQFSQIVKRSDPRISFVFGK